MDLLIAAIFGKRIILTMVLQKNMRICLPSHLRTYSQSLSIFWQDQSQPANKKFLHSCELPIKHNTLMDIFFQAS